jgi:hypothetical protein
MLKPPDDDTRLELSSFVRPDSVPGSPAAMANELGLHNVASEVNDLQAAVDWAATEGYRLVGGIGEYEGAWRMAYVRGRKGSSSHWPSAPAEPRNARICRRSGGPAVAIRPGDRSSGCPRLRGDACRNCVKRPRGDARICRPYRPSG